MTEIFVNNELIELFNDETIVISYAVNNLFEIESRQGTYSNSFKIPATKKNNIILGFTNNVLSVSDLPYLKLPCLIYVDGILQVEGIAQILTATPSEYEVRVLGSNANWFELISDKSLQTALQGCEYTHLWNYPNVTANRSNNWPDVFVYPNIDYGGLFFEPIAGPPYTADWFKLYPAVYCKYLFKQIFDNVGLTIDSDWFDNDPLFAKQIIPFCSEFKRDKVYNLRDSGYWDGPISTPYLPVFSVHDVYLQNTIQSNCYNIRTSTGILTILDNCFLTFRLKVRVANPFGFNRVFNFSIWYTDGDGNAQQEIFFSQLLTPFQVVTFEDTFTRHVGRTELNLKYFLFGSGLVSGDVNLCEFEIIDYIPTGSDEGDLEIDQVFNWITLGSTLPDISQTDFLLTIANQYGLIFEQIPLSNTVRIFQFGKIIQNLPKALDWSNKLDLSEDYSITFFTDTYAQTNIFKYAEDTGDEYLSRQPNLGQGVLTLESAPANTELIVFESVFAPLIRLNSFNGPTGVGGVVPLAWVPVYENGAFNSLTPRLGYVDFDTSALLTIGLGGFYSTPQPNVYFDDLSFAKLLPEYYPLFEQTINGNKAVTCLVRLNNIDINQLDFSIPVWIDYFGAFFYINEISQYKVTDKDSTQITLILIVN